MEVLVGSTGFVGGNLAAAHSFDMLCHSPNVACAFGTNPDLLVYAGVPAEMFLANHDPEADRRVTENAAENIRKIAPRRVVLISTIAVLDHPAGADEDAVIHPDRLTAYGRNRLNLEKAVGVTIPHCHVIRLPALFGKGLKKNFLYDMKHVLPAMLTQGKLDELSQKEPMIAKSYALQDNGFYKLAVSAEQKPALKAAFARCGFSALHFTDSRSTFQYYNLAYLWQHIVTMIRHGIPLLHAATEPVSAGALYESIARKPFTNELAKPPFAYDFRTQYGEFFGGRNGYLFDQKQVVEEIRQFWEAGGV